MSMDATETIMMLQQVIVDFMGYKKTMRERIEKLEAENAILRGERRADAVHTSTPRKNVYMKILKK